MSAWQATATNMTDSNAGTPADASAVPRYQGICAIQVALNGVSQRLGDNSPGRLGGLSRYRARFYVNAGNAALNAGDSVALFRGFDDLDGGGVQQFEVRLENANGTLQAVLQAGGQTLTAPLAATAWHSVEIDWNADQTEIWLAADGQSGISIPATLSGAIHSVLLGNLNGFSNGGTLGFDAFESRRAESSGRLCEGDTNLDSLRDLDDVFAVFGEFASAGNELASGQPDITEDASVNLDDVFSIFDLFATAQGACS